MKERCKPAAFHQTNLDHSKIREAASSGTIARAQRELGWGIAGKMTTRPDIQAAAVVQRHKWAAAEQPTWWTIGHRRGHFAEEIQNAAGSHPCQCREGPERLGIRDAS